MSTALLQAFIDRQAELCEKINECPTAESVSELSELVNDQVLSNLKTQIDIHPLCWRLFFVAVKTIVFKMFKVPILSLANFVFIL